MTALAGARGVAGCNGSSRHRGRLPDPFSMWRAVPRPQTIARDSHVDGRVGRAGKPAGSPILSVCGVWFHVPKGSLRRPERVGVAAGRDLRAGHRVPPGRGESKLEVQ